tara:strand:- start:243 stop:1649 length:1407 start_codon:yes stop_codon:yes gene_type:complete
MDSKNFTMQSKVKFRSNFGSFNLQPIVTLVDNNAITGGRFISLYRIRRGREESLNVTATDLSVTSSDGILGLSYGDGIGLTSLSGSHRIRSQSLTSSGVGLTADWGVPPLHAIGGVYQNILYSTTADEREYNINLIVDGNNKINVVVEDNNVFFGDIAINSPNTNPSYNFMGLAFRPNSCGIPVGVSANGELGSSLVNQYFYNRNEKLNTELFGIDPSLLPAGLTSVQDWSGNGVSAGIYGKAADALAEYHDDNNLSGTVTGWTYGPIEGGFKLDGYSHIESISSSLFNTRSLNTSGVTLMTHVKFFSTGDTNIATIGSCGSVLAGIALRRGAIEVIANGDSITAGAITSTTNDMAGSGYVHMNQWMHIAAVLRSGSATTTGTSMFINGEKVTLARSTTSISAAVSFPVINDDGRLIIGKNMNRTTSALTGVIGLTRVFNRPLTDAEIFENFITSIPSQSIINEINIA